MALAKQRPGPEGHPSPTMNQLEDYESSQEGSTGSDDSTTTTTTTTTGTNNVHERVRDPRFPRHLTNEQVTNRVRSLHVPAHVSYHVNMTGDEIEMCGDLVYSGLYAWNPGLGDSLYTVCDSFVCTLTRELYAIKIRVDIIRGLRHVIQNLEHHVVTRYAIATEIVEDQPLITDEPVMGETSVVYSRGLHAQLTWLQYGILRTYFPNIKNTPMSDYEDMWNEHHLEHQSGRYKHRQKRSPINELEELVIELCVSNRDNTLDELVDIVITDDNVQDLLVGSGASMKDVKACVRDWYCKEYLQSHACDVPVPITEAASIGMPDIDVGKVFAFSGKMAESIAIDKSMIDVVSTAVNIVCAINNLRNVDTNNRVAVATTIWSSLSSILGTNTIPEIICEFIMSVFSPEGLQHQSAPIISNSGNGLRWDQKFAAMYSSVSYSPLRLHAIGLVSAVIAFRSVTKEMLSVDGLQGLYDLLTTKMFIGNDFVVGTFNSISYFAEGAWRVFATGNICEMFNVTDDIAKACCNASYLYSNIESVLNGNYQGVTYKSVDYFRRVMKDTQDLLKSIVRPGYRKIDVDRAKAQMTQVSTKFAIFERACNFRIQAYSFSVYGGTGVGKSSLERYMTRALLIHNEFSAEDKDIITLSTEEQFWSNYRSDVTAVLLDDFANMHPSMTKVSPSNFVIKLINNIPTTAPMADLADKGKVIVQPKIVSCTTNVQGLHATTFSSAPESILRRFRVHLSIKVKPMYQKEGSEMLDNDNTQVRADIVTDVWEITAYEVHVNNKATSLPVGSNQTNGVVSYAICKNREGKEMKDVGFYEILDFMYTDSKKYFAFQHNYVECLANCDKKLNICKKCLKLMPLCRCDGKNPFGKQPSKSPDGDGSDPKLPPIPAGFVVIPPGPSDTQVQHHEDPLLDPYATMMAAGTKVPYSEWINAWFKSQGTDETPENGVYVSLKVPLDETEGLYNEAELPIDIVTESIGLDSAYVAMSENLEHQSSWWAPKKKRTYFSIVRDTASLACTQFTCPNKAMATVVSGFGSALALGAHDWLAGCGQTCYSYLNPSAGVRCLNGLESLTDSIEDTAAAAASLLSGIDIVQKSKYTWVYDAMPTFMRNTPLFDKMFYHLERERMFNTWAFCALPLNCVYSAISVFSATRVVRRPYVICPLWTTCTVLTLGANAIILGKTREVIMKSAAQFKDPNALVAQSSEMDKMKKRVVKAAVLAGVAFGAVTAIKILAHAWATFMADDKQEQAIILGSTDDSHLSKLEVKNDIWLSKPIENTPAGTMTLPDLMNRIGSCCVRVVVNEKKANSAMFLTSDVLVMPYHGLFTGDVNGKMSDVLNLQLITAPKTKQGKAVTGWLAKRSINSKTDVVRVGTTDLALVRVNCGSKYGAYEHLAPPNATTNYRSLMRDDEGDLIEGFGQLNPGSRVQVCDKLGWSSVVHTADHNKKWQAGDCGTVFITHESPPRLAGFHIAGWNPAKVPEHQLFEGTLCSLTQEEFKEYSKVLFQNELVPLSGNVVSMTSMGKDIGYRGGTGVSELNYMSKYTDSPTLSFLGYVNGGASPTTNLRKTEFSPILERHLPAATCKWGSPTYVVKRVVTNSDGVEKTITDKFPPWEKALKNMVAANNITDVESLRWAIDDYTKPMEELVAKQASHSHMNLGKLSEDAIVNGIDGVRFIDKMNFNTSMGFPVGGKKIDHLVSVGVGDKKQFANPVVWDEVKQAEQEYLAGKTNGFIMKASLKDEVKEIDPETGTFKMPRVFYAAPITLQLLVRKYYLPILKFLCMNPLESEIAVGINPFSLQWQDLHDHWTKFNKKATDKALLCYDYKNWDQKNSVRGALAGFQAMIRIAKASGKYSGDDIRIMQGIATDVSYANINFNGSLIECWGVLVSGINVTAVLNCIVNVIYQRMAYHHLIGSSGLKLDPFRHNVSAMTYGDDTISGVHRLIRHLYNYQTVKQYLAEYTGITMTPPNKTSDDSRITLFNIHDEGADFLKRHTKTVEGLVYKGNPVHIGVLTLDSIYKSLHFTDVSKTREYNVVADTLRSASMELFYHGRSVYDAHMASLKAACAEAKMVVSDLNTTYDERVQKWLDTYVNSETDVQNITEVSHLTLEHLVAQSCALPDCIDYHPCVWGGLQDGIPNIVECEHTHSAHCAPPGSECMRELRPTNKEEETINERAGCEEPRLVSHGVCDLIHQSETLVDFEMPGGSELSATAHEGNSGIIETPDEELSLFFKRPILIENLVWEPDMSLNYDINVLSRLLNNKRILNRLNNFSWITGTMCLRFELVGTAFMYGTLIAAVNHWPMNDDTITTYAAATPSLTQLSQLPHIYMNPTTANGGCLSIPIIHPYGYLPLAVGVDGFSSYSDVVRVHLRTLNNLKAVSTAAQQDVNINVYAWFEDIQLGGPVFDNLSNLVAQSGDVKDEAHNFSSAATVVAGMAGSMASMPTIGPYAKSVEVAARTAANIAQKFGFSRPINTLNEVRSVRHFIGNMANTNVADPALNLAMDAKQEVTIDPVPAGADAGDHMSLAKIAKTECWLSSHVWSVDQIQGSVFTYVNVTPCLSKQLIANTGGRIPTPAAHAAEPFKYWRGSFELRVEVVCSAFHKGKLRVVYDPRSLIRPTSDWTSELNLGYSSIIDISENREFTFRVGWQNIRPYLKVKTMLDLNSNFGPEAWGLASSMEYFNGTIGVHVMNPLVGSAGVLTNPVYINLFVKMCDDFEVAVPACGNLARLSVAQPYSVVGTDDLTYQSEMVEVPGGDQDAGDSTYIELNKKPITSEKVLDELALVHLGERITTLRQIMKRYCYAGLLDIRHIATSLSYTWKRVNVFRVTYPDFPQTYGYVRSGNPYLLYDGVTQAIYSNGSNFMTWFAPCYLMRRGGILQKYVPHNSVSGNSTTVNETYIIKNVTGLGYSYLASGWPFSNTAGVYNLGYQSAPSAMCGMYQNEPGAAMCVQTPYQLNRKWIYSQLRDVSYNNPDLDKLREQGSHTLGIRIDYPTSPPETNPLALMITWMRYTAAADDFSFMTYKYAPLVFTPVLGVPTIPLV